ncbi:LuxR family transcriptional regulator [Saccharopolyspora taberi]|uniref:LuxR family transcriptional regulator n=1 Tax=Saccharopolyspora taberi TaxID=60895 RepID=A0ABN3VL81_9PSEU
MGRLPDDLTSFVGRRGMSAQVRRLVSSSRLVTLTGVAGVGKSRLAAHVARGLRRAFPDGVWLVDLARVAEPDLLGRAVTTGLDLRDQPWTTPEALADQLADKRMLVVLDGCEHLLDACGTLVGAMLARAPEVRVLVTSRSPLGIAGEQICPVPPMSVPTRGGGEALALFEDRAAAVQPGFAVGPHNQQAVARLCRGLDGLPLAIELAAVWMRSLSVEEILDRLGDRYRLLTGGDRSAAPHHRTLRAAIAWSFDLCSPIERTLWARLSVFAGGFELAAAEDVCAGDGVSAEELFLGIAGLVERSVLTREDSGGSRTRYRLLRTLGEYGRERLGAEELVLRRRHRDHYLRLAECADAEWLGPSQLEWLRRLRLDRENLRAALDFCGTEPGEEALRLAAALRFHWIAGGALADGRDWLDDALALTSGPSSHRARVLAINALVSAMQGDTGAALEMVAEARELGDPLVPNVSGVIDLLRGDFAGAVDWFEESMRQPELLNHDGLAVMSLPNRALLAIFDGEPERAAQLCEQAVEICEEHGEKWARSWAELVLGLCRWRQGDLPAATAHVQAALRTKDLFHDLPGILLCLEALAWIETKRHHPHRAVRLFAAAGELWKPLGTHLFGIEQYEQWHRESAAAARRALRPDEFREAERKGASFTLAEAVAYALGERRPTRAAHIPEQLTKREHEVAQLVARGLSNRQIAEQLVIAKRTSDSHIEHILTKLGFSSRAQIAAWVAEQP